MGTLRYFLTLCLFLSLGYGCSSKTTTPEIQNERFTTPPANKVQQQKLESVNEVPAREANDTVQDSQITKSGEENNLPIAAAETDEDLSDDFSEEGDEFNEFDEFEEEFGDAEEQEVWDPLEGYNRVMTSFNDKMYLWVLTPVAKGYRWAVPEGARRGIGRFFTNLLYPVRAVNNLLQGKFKNTGEETLRFVTNSTIGIFGFFDPAKVWFGLEPHDEDLGQTLGYYGVGAGPHVVLPFFGPRNLRDALTMYPETVYLDPKTYYVEGTARQVGVYAFDTVNEVSLNIGAYESLKKDALDFYKFMRDSYEQKRIREIEE